MKTVITLLLALGISPEQQEPIEDQTGNDSITESEGRFLDDINFVFFFEGNWAIELVDARSFSTTQRQELQGKLRESDFRYFEPINVGNAHEEQLHDSGHSIGTLYRCYFPITGRSFDFRLVAYGLTPTGDGGVAGISGILSPMSQRGLEIVPSRSKRENIRPAGVGWKLESAIADETAPMRTSAQIPIAEDPSFADVREQGEIESVIESPRHPSNIILVRLKEKDGPKTKAYCYLRQGNTLNLLPFPGDGDAAEILDDPSGDKDTTPFGGIAYLLPDLDQNGLPEIFIQNTISKIYEIRRGQSGGDPIIDLVKWIYFGP